MTTRSAFRSCLYVGSVAHRRLRPRVHHFRYRVFWLLVDLDELPQLSEKLRLFSHNSPNIFSLYDSDHGDGSAMPLRRQVGRQLGLAGIDLAGGAIRLLCMPRTLGYCFNPLSIYFCYFPDGSLAALIYQVHNTFGGRHSYLIAVQRDSGAVHQRCRKSLYVSPFMDMNMSYEFRVTGPGERCAVAIGARAPGGPMFLAALAGSREELKDLNLMRRFFTVPAVTMKVMTAIHWEALRLWLKGIRYRSPPAAPASTISIVPVSGKVD